LIERPLVGRVVMALSAGGFFMSLFLEICMALAMLGIAVYTCVMAGVAVMAHRAKVAMHKPTEEAHPPYITGEDLLG
tara:strand:- start:149 stop:379 length:231 start_codon:yes stop_codon:yes gene_type:complete